ncbi:GTP-binding protein, partial [Reticulomyxa filosa]
MRLTKDKFLGEYDPTIEDNYKKKTEVDGKPALLDILDTAVLYWFTYFSVYTSVLHGHFDEPFFFFFFAVFNDQGQEDFVTMKSEWFREGEGFIIVYSITSEDSLLQDAAKYHDEILSEKGTSKVPMYYVKKKKKKNTYLPPPPPSFFLLTVTIFDERKNKKKRKKDPTLGF